MLGIYPYILHFHSCISPLEIYLLIKYFALNSPNRYAEIIYDFRRKMIDTLSLLII